MTTTPPITQRQHFRLTTLSDTFHVLHVKKWFGWCKIRDLQMNWHDANRVMGRYEWVDMVDKRKN